MTVRPLLALVTAVALAALACGTTADPASTRESANSALAADSRGGSAVNIYEHAGANARSPEAARARPLVYVPNSRSKSVSVIDPKTYGVVRTFETGAVPQHVVPSYDLKRLWVLNNEQGTLTPIDPLTGQDGPPVHVDDPYNMYFTPDGRYAIVVAEHRQRLDFRDAQTMQLVH